MIRTPSALAAAAILLALSLAGCGGDQEASDEGSSDAAALTQDEFVEQGNAICAAGNEELAAGAADLDTADPDAVAAYATDVLVPNIRQQLDDLRALGYPEDDAELLESTFADADTALDEIEADPSQLTGGEPFADVNTALQDYGLTECGS